MKNLKHIIEAEHLDNWHKVLELVQATPEEEFDMRYYTNFKKIPHDIQLQWGVNSSEYTAGNGTNNCYLQNNALPHGTTFCMAGLIWYNYAPSKFRNILAFAGKFLGIPDDLSWNVFCSCFFYARPDLLSITKRDVEEKLQEIIDAGGF